MIKFLETVTGFFEEYPNIEVEYSIIESSILITKYMEQDKYIMLVHPESNSYKVCSRLQKPDGQYVQLADKTYKTQRSAVKYITNILG